MVYTVYVGCGCEGWVWDIIVICEVLVVVCEVFVVSCRLCGILGVGSEE